MITSKNMKESGLKASISPPSYVYSWEKIGRQYSVFLIDDKSVEFKSGSFATALAELEAWLYEKREPGHALSSARPPPGNDIFFIPNYGRISAHESVPILEKYADEYSGGQCEKCQYVVGMRLSSPTVLIKKARSDVVFFWGDRASRVLYSRKLLDFLNNQAGRELPHMQALEKSGKKSGYFELLEPAAVHSVAVKGGKTYGWQCSCCDRRAFGSRHPKLKGSLIKFILRSSITLKPSLFFGDFGFRSEPIVLVSRLEHFIAAKLLKGISIGKIALLEDGDADKHPPLGDFEPD